MVYKKSSNDSNSSGSSSESGNYANGKRSNNISGSKTNFKTTKLFNNNAILVTNGSIKDYGFVYRTLIKNFQSLSDTFVIAADGGAQHCSNLRITPNVIIGDMDSITKGMIEKLRYSAGRDSGTTGDAAGGGIGGSSTERGAIGGSNSIIAGTVSDSSIIGGSSGNASESSIIGGSNGNARGSNLSGSNLSGSNLSGSNLSASNLSSSNLIASSPNSNSANNDNFSGSSNTSAREIEFISFNQAKDESDTQLALDYLVKNGYERILVIGAFGSRADHSYANLSLLSSPAYDNVKVSIITDNSEVFVIKNSCTIKGEAGKKISIFSLTPFTFFEKTSGLKYRLKNEKLLFSPARGLSNEFVKNSAKINITEGWLLVIREL